MDEMSNSKEFQRHLQSETLTETYLNSIDTHLKDCHISRAELADWTGYDLKQIYQWFDRTRELTISDMSNIAYALGLVVELRVRHK